MLTFDKSNPSFIAHRLVEAVEKYQHVIEAATPVNVAMVGAKIPSNTGGVIVAKLKTGKVSDANTSHDWNAAKIAVSAYPEKIHLVYVESTNNVLQYPLNLRASLDLGVEVSSVSVSHHMFPWRLGLGDMANYHNRDVAFCTHFAFNNSCPAAYIDRFGENLKSFFVAIAVDEAGKKTSGVFLSGKQRQLGVVASAPSWASPLLSSFVAFLKLLNPKLKAEEIYEIMYNTGTHEGGKPVFVDMLRAADFIMHGSVDVDNAAQDMETTTTEVEDSEEIAEAQDEATPSLSQLFDVEEPAEPVKKNDE